MTKERAKELLNKLLELEEKNNIGNLTTRERREFQSIVEDWVDETCMHVEAPQGVLVVEKCDATDFTSVMISLDKGEKVGTIDIANIEYDNEKDSFHTTVWSDAQSNEYTHQIELENLETVKEEPGRE